jgi:anhydro-N-acetylmuramic acid kinase
MSGTSLDGIDVAMLETDGVTISRFGGTYFRPYTRGEREIIQAATQAALAWNFKGVPPNIFAQAEQLVDEAHIDAVSGYMTENNLTHEDISLIGYHGQTLLHRPPDGQKTGQTLQMGRGDRLATALKIDTIYDFRSADMKMGGQGAPLAPIYHAALLKNAGISIPAAIVNIGGVSNITIVDQTGNIMASDCGPGNGPLDTWMSNNGLGEYDQDGNVSQSGSPDFRLIDKWLERPFFKKPIPKSADRWDFDVLEDLSNFSIESGAATLATFTAVSILETVRSSGQTIEKLIVCGGGRKNGAIMGALMEMELGVVLSAEKAGFRGDDIEAEAFAYLAARSLNGLPLSYPTTTGVSNPVSGGVLTKA